METEKKNNIYDSVKVGIRGLTAIIVLGLVLLGLLMAYGYFSGQKSDRSIAVEKDAEIMLIEKSFC